MKKEEIRVIEPKVDFLSYGPTLKVTNEIKENSSNQEIILSPDDVVYGAAGVTFKGVNFINDVINLKKEGNDFVEKRNKSLISSAGAGHASLSTSIGFWTILQGDCSKLIDSVFTGATYISALMPSGRRIPITKEEIIVPKGIADKGGEVLNTYLNVSEKNIEFYTKLQEEGISNQDASKIVQYGHSGGGFLYMPLETLVYFSRLKENNEEDIPLEGVEIINQLEKIVHQNGMGVTYEARKNAPRTTNVNPEIFHHRKTAAEEIFYYMKNEVELKPKILNVKDSSLKLRDKRIDDYLKAKEEYIKSFEWEKSLNNLFEITSDYNLSLDIEMITNTPWRIWGEVKRHRTLNQTSSSIYHFVDRAMNEYLHNQEDNEESYERIKNLKRFMSLPQSIETNKINYDEWRERFIDSLKAYEFLLERGVKESDAISIIPRGIKFPLIKDYDLWNLVLGYSPLRQCKGSVEPEMSDITIEEMELIKKEDRISDSIKELIAPKCNCVGFCLEKDYKKCCGLVRQITTNYDKDMHKKIWDKKEEAIRNKI